MIKSFFSLLNRNLSNEIFPFGDVIISRGAVEIFWKQRRWIFRSSLKKGGNKINSPVIDISCLRLQLVRQWMFIQWNLAGIYGRARNYSFREKLYCDRNYISSVRGCKLFVVVAWMKSSLAALVRLCRNYWCTYTVPTREHRVSSGEEIRVNVVIKLLRIADFIIYMLICIV